MTFVSSRRDFLEFDDTVQAADLLVKYDLAYPAANVIAFGAYDANFDDTTSYDLRTWLLIGDSRECEPYWGSFYDGTIDICLLPNSEAPRGPCFGDLVLVS